MNEPTESGVTKVTFAAAGRRRGNMLVFFVLLLPAIFGVLGLVIDGGMLRLKYRIAQNVADAAATAAATALANGSSNSVAQSVATEYVNNYNGLSSASVSVEIPPVDGPYAGQSGYVEVQVSLPVSTYFMQVVGGTGSYPVKATSVAGCRNATAGAAIVVLDPDPPGLSVPTIAGITLPTTPSANLGGLEILGIGQLRVDGAVLVDTTWGGVDKYGYSVGSLIGLHSAIQCMPVLQLTSLAALDIRVTGGVDNPNNYSNYVSGQSSPLQANRKAVPDPLNNLPVPTVSVDPNNVSATQYGGVNVVGLPLIGPVTTLQPGVYDYISIVSGTVVMQSGVYIIRGQNPLTGIALEMIGGQVTANGVMFYITNSANYSATNGAPDSGNNNATPAPLSVTSVLPSVVIDAGLLGSSFTPISSGSVYDGILLFQNRTDRRIIVITRDELLTTSTWSGTLYAKWGQVILASMGTFDAKFVVGSMRFINILDVTLQPSSLLPPAQDVYLVQ